ncbi:MAG: SpoIIE family protein phosphatase [Acidobacteriaceae bacterium]
MKKIVCLLLFSLLCACALPAQTFSLITGREPVASLDGLWRFHTGDNPARANPNFDDSQWPLLRSDEDWAKQGYKDYSGYAWYRFTLQVPAGEKPLSLLLMPIQTSYQVYVDGKLIGGFGYMPPRELALWSRLEVYDLPRTGQAGPRILHIAIRVWQYQEWASYAPGGILQPGSAAGASPLIRRRLQNLEAVTSSQFANTYTYGVVTLLFGLIVLGLFLFPPAEREYLWFALLLLAAAADTANAIGLDLSLTPVQIYDTIDGLMLAIFQIAGLLFFARVLRVRRDFWWWFACVAALIAYITEFTYILHFTSVAVSGVLSVLFFLPSELWILTVLVRSAVRKDANARLLLVPVLLDYGFVLVDNLTQISYQLGWQSRLFTANVPLLNAPYPLRLANVVFTIFVLAMMLFLVRRFSLARREEERLSKELEAARSMQSLLVPATPPVTPGFQVESVYLPASEVGGDFFQILPGNDGSLLIVVGDVSGKGLKAAMTVSTIIGALRGCAIREPAEVLANLNRVLHGQITGFATCCAASITAGGTMTIANAGHIPPYRNGEELAVQGGLPLGILAACKYEETQFEVARGDRLTFVSDGVVEATNVNHELFGFARTQAISREPAHTIAEAAKTFGQEDDISVLSVTRIDSMKAALA